MSKIMLRPSSKKLSPLNQKNPFSQKKVKKKANSQNKYFKALDMITQVKPSYLNNFIQPINPHQSAFTPTNHSKLSKGEELLLPPKSNEFANKKTLILDLDETLVHSSFTPFEKNDIILEVDFDGMIYNIYVLVRPEAENFIKKISQFFEVVIFTASLSNYASPLLDILDSDNNIKYRLYREHCTFINGIFVKDLKKLNRNLKDLIIVDNSPLAYAFDTDNGLPIKTWYEDPYDVELTKIFTILEFLAKTNDVRKHIKNFVKDNVIIYEDALNYIKNIENKSKNSNNANNNVSKNNNSFITKTNSTNLLNNTTYNENNTSIFNGNKNSKNGNKISNLKDNIYFNCNPINICASSVEGSKNPDIKKNIVKYKLNQENKNKNRNQNNNENNSYSYTKSNENNKNNNNINNKSLKSDLALVHNSQIKKNIFSLHDIEFMNNIIKKQKIDNFENGKLNEKILLVNNAKQKHKNNNIFRFSQKNEFQNNGNNFFNNNKFNSIIPININSSNKSKNLLPHQPFLQINKNNNINYSKIPNIISNINNETKKKLKNNYINLIQDKKQNKKHYTNLLNKFGNGKIKPFYQGIMENKKNLLKIEKFGIGNVKKARLRISSSISSHRNLSLLSGNKIKDFDKNYTSFHIQRSKSTGQFFNQGKQIKPNPKTPNRQIIFPKGETENEKQQKNFNLFNEFFFANTTKFQNVKNIGNENYKLKRAQSSKRK